MTVLDWVNVDLDRLSMGYLNLGVLVEIDNDATVCR